VVIEKELLDCLPADFIYLKLEKLFEENGLLKPAQKRAV
jgi:hypothetical protein